MAEAIDRLALNPVPPDSKTLSGLKGCRRIRVGDWRVVYRIEHARLVILILRLGHRREIYRNL